LKTFGFLSNCTIFAVYRPLSGAPPRVFRAIASAVFVKSMETKKSFNNIFNIALSLCLGSAILYWMYRDFDFKRVEQVMLNEMNWWWMLLSFPFGILAQAFRGWRWKQALEPVG